MLPQNSYAYKANPEVDRGLGPTPERLQVANISANLIIQEIASKTPTSIFNSPKIRIGHLRKPRVLTPLRSLRRNEVELVPLACEDVASGCWVDFNT